MSRRGKIKVSAGDRYSLLTVIKEVKREKIKGRFVLCKCNCGKEKIISLQNLRSKMTRSCGCLAKNNWKGNKNFHNKSHTRIYAIWSDMKVRCLNSDYRRFKDYGGRGISVCEEWMDFENFYKWAKENGYRSDLTIDRIDNDGDYEPSNCQWSTQKKQASNRRTTVRVERGGVTKPLREWCEIEGVGFNMVYRRLRRGWDIEEALSVPPIPQGHKHAN